MKYDIKVKYKVAHSSTIVGLLKKGTTTSRLVQLGYPKSTVFYHYNKLFRPQVYLTFLKKIKASTLKARAK